MERIKDQLRLVLSSYITGTVILIKLIIRGIKFLGNWVAKILRFDGLLTASLLSGLFIIIYLLSFTTWKSNYINISNKLDLQTYNYNSNLDSLKIIIELDSIKIDKLSKNIDSLTSIKIKKAR